MDNLQYCFEGTVKVICNHCHKSHELVFDGDEQSTLETAIEEALFTAGWDTKKLVCADCYDPLEEPLDEDDDLEDDYFEEINELFEKEDEE